MRQLTTVLGYGLSMAMLAAASLIVIRSMARASGELGWGAIAYGQMIGAVGAVLLGYGWNIIGPAAIATATATDRLTEFRHAWRARGTIALPIAVLVCTVTAVTAPAEHRHYAIAGALSALAIGFTTQWFWVGMASPWTLLTVETLPRVLGTVIGIIAMETGSSALVGVLCQLGGMLCAVAIASVVAWSRLRAAGADVSPTSPTLALLRRQWDGVGATTGMAALGLVPVAIVRALAAPVLPMFLFATKIQQQATVALTPAVTVLQGWVPRGNPAARARRALLLACVVAALVCGAILLAGPWVTQLLGGGEIRPGYDIIVAMATIVALAHIDGVLSFAILPALDRVRAVARATILGAVVGLPLVIVGALVAGATGALTGVAISYVARLCLLIVTALAPEPPRSPHPPATPTTEDNDAVTTPNDRPVPDMAPSSQ